MWYDLENLIKHTKTYLDKDWDLQSIIRTNWDDSDNPTEVTTTDAEIKFKYGSVRMYLGNYYKDLGPPYLEPKQPTLYLSCGIMYNLPRLKGDNFSGRDIGGGSGGSIHSIEDFDRVFKGHLDKLRVKYGAVQQALF